VNGHNEAVWNQVMAVRPDGMPQYDRQIPHGADTALLFAERLADLESAKPLVEAGGTVNDPHAWGVTPTTRRHSGFAESARAAPGARDPNLAAPRFTALHAAIMRRYDEMVSAPLAHCADPNAPLRRWTPTPEVSFSFAFRYLRTRHDST
jgi:hypothetical protein